MDLKKILTAPTALGFASSGLTPDPATDPTVKLNDEGRIGARDSFA